MTATNPWREAIIDALVVSHIYRAEHEDNPRMALHDLIAWEVTIALDPLVSSGAQELIQRGRNEAQRDASRWRQARAHWNEFGPEQGFGELMDRLQEGEQ